MKRTGFFLQTALVVCFFICSQSVFPQKSAKPKPSPGNKTTIIQYRENDNRYTTNTTSDIADLLRKNTENYFRVDKSERTLWNGKHWNPVDYPLKVYVKNVNSVYFKNTFRSFIDYAMGIWENADPRIKFRYESNPADADIIIEFEDNLITKYDDNYLGITDYKLEDDKKIDKSYIEIGLLKFNDERVTDGEVKATIIHEFGHALGLGHSENEIDIMFPFINPFSGTEMEYDDLSGGDIQAVRSAVSLGFETN